MSQRGRADRAIVFVVLGLALGFSLFNRSHVVKTQTLSSGTQVRTVGPLGEELCNSGMLAELNGCVKATLWQRPVSGEFPKQWATVRILTTIGGFALLVFAGFGRVWAKLRPTLAVAGALAFGAAAVAAWRFGSGVKIILASHTDSPMPSPMVSHHVFLVAAVAASIAGVVVGITQARKTRHGDAQVPPACALTDA